MEHVRDSAHCLMLLVNMCAFRFQSIAVTIIETIETECSEYIHILTQLQTSIAALKHIFCTEKIVVVMGMKQQNHYYRRSPVHRDSLYGFGCLSMTDE